MNKRISALLAVVTILAWSLPARAAAAELKPDVPAYRGAFMQVQSLDDLPAYEKTVDKIADTGADTVLIVPQVQQENGRSTVVFMDGRLTPTSDRLGNLIDYCRQKKLRVGLMPIVLLTRPGSDQWRGTLRPDSWHQWFDSYRAVVQTFADVAQAHDVDLLFIGSELISTEGHLDEWTQTIDLARSRFKGRLAYTANWDHFNSVPFWDQIDAIGVNCYYSLGDGPDVTVDQIKERWHPIKQTLTDFAKARGKSLILSEVGWCSVDNAASEPWDYTKAYLRANNDLQARLYQAFFETWYGEPTLGGFFVVEWIPGRPAEKGYTPEGKPAEKVLRSFMAKPSWTPVARK